MGAGRTVANEWLVAGCSAAAELLEHLSQRAYTST